MTRLFDTKPFWILEGKVNGEWTSTIRFFYAISETEAIDEMTWYLQHKSCPEIPDNIRVRRATDQEIENVAMDNINKCETDS